VSKTAYIGYGFMEGPRHGQRMRAALSRRGFTLAKSPKHAQLIVAHSGAHMFLELPKKDQTYLLIDASYSTGRSAFDNALRHIWYDLRYILGKGQWYYYGWKTGWNIYYFFRYINRWMQMYHRLRKVEYSPARFAWSAVVTQSSDLSWYNKTALAKTRMIRIDADHDDCWRHPDRYLDLVDSES
jgi:hypothetical protein